MSRALSITELCDHSPVEVPASVAPGAELHGRLTTASPSAMSVSHLEARLRLAKEHGLYISMSEEMKRSQVHCQLVLRFLSDFSKLRAVDARASGKSGNATLAETIASVSSPDFEPHSGSADSSDHASESDESDEYDESDEKPSADAAAAIEVSRLKRKGFPFNPVCLHCKLQYDEDNNPDGCCMSHTGTLQGDFDHEYFDDDDFPEHTEYDGSALDAWQWTCCDGDAEAPPCRIDKHEERYGTRPRYA